MPRVAFPALVLVLVACRSGDVNSEGTAPPPVASVLAPERFGSPLTPSPVLPLARVLSAPDEFSSKTVTVEGLVRRNCTRRGCWMELAEGIDESLQGCRVTFQNYGFFVPLNSAGARAKVQGSVTTRVVSKNEVDHMESEGASFASKLPDGTAREVRIVAIGVELSRS